MPGRGGSIPPSGFSEAKALVTLLMAHLRRGMKVFSGVTSLIEIEDVCTVFKVSKRHNDLKVDFASLL
jgi:hypothetical protein